MSVKETVNVTERGRGTGKETESGKERGSANETGRGIVKESESGIGTEKETESVTERRVDLLEMWSTLPSGDQVQSRH